MKFYRNVKVANDPTMNRKVVDEYDELAATVHNTDLSAFLNDVPGVAPEGFQVDADAEVELEIGADEEAVMFEGDLEADGGDDEI